MSMKSRCAAVVSAEGRQVTSVVWRRQPSRELCAASSGAAAKGVRAPLAVMHDADSWRDKERFEQHWRATPR